MSMPRCNEASCGRSALSLRPITPSFVRYSTKATRSIFARIGRFLRICICVFGSNYCMLISTSLNLDHSDVCPPRQDLGSEIVQLIQQSRPERPRTLDVFPSSSDLRSDGHDQHSAPDVSLTPPIGITG